jgi:hypothetical protein
LDKFKNLTNSEMWNIIWASDRKKQRMFSERVITMSQSKIKLNATEEVQEFVNAASRCDFDIDVYYNRFLIDAKSILGVLSLDLTRELTVDCHGESREFDRTLKKFAVA